MADRAGGWRGEAHRSWEVDKIIGNVDDSESVVKEEIKAGVSSVDDSKAVAATADNEKRPSLAVLTMMVSRQSTPTATEGGSRNCC